MMVLRGQILGSVYIYIYRPICPAIKTREKSIFLIPSILNFKIGICEAV